MRMDPYHSGWLAILALLLGLALALLLGPGRTSSARLMVDESSLPWVPRKP